MGQSKRKKTKIEIGGKREAALGCSMSLETVIPLLQPFSLIGFIPN